MKSEFPLTGSSCFGDYRNNWLHKRLWLNNKRNEHLRLSPTDKDLAQMLITEIAKVSAPKNKKNAPAAESGDKKRKRTGDKLIRLDDLIPEKDVKGGRQLPFGVADTTQTKEKRE